MAFIKISDPNIIDLAAWHQVINVVNQHSESISSLTNTTGVSWNPDYDPNKDGGWKTVYDAGNQKIQYGKSVMTSALNEASVSTGAYGTFYDEEVTFPTSFSATPSVTATCTSSNGDTAKLNLLTCTVSNITQTSFNIRLTYPGISGTNIVGVPIPGTSWKTYISWVAIGPVSS